MLSGIPSDSQLFEQRGSTFTIQLCLDHPFPFIKTAPKQILKNPPPMSFTPTPTNDFKVLKRIRKIRYFGFMNVYQ